MKSKLLRVALLALVLLVVLAPAASAGGLADDKVVVGENYVLASGQRLAGNLAVIGGNVTLERDSVVEGDVAVMGGALAASGAIHGSVAVFGGSVDLTDTAVVQGDLAAFGGSVQRASGAVISGDVFGPRLPELPIRPTSPAAPRVNTNNPGAGGVLGDLVRWQLGTLGWSLALVLLGILAVVVAPRGLSRIASTASTELPLSLGVGLLTLAVATLGGALLLIACGLGLLVWLVTAFGLLIGWLAVGLWGGQRLLRALRLAQTSALAEVALGVFLITVLGRLPVCIGFFFSLAVGAIGLGAVVLTRFGTQIYSGAVRPVSNATPLALGGAPLVPEDGLALGVPPVVVAGEELLTPPGDSLTQPSAVAMDDDLEIIIGVGPADAILLRAAGVNTLAQLASVDPTALSQATGLPVERIDQEDWIGQARRLTA